MKITPKSNIKKHQTGGQMVPAEPMEQAPMETSPVEEAPQENPLIMLAEVAMLALQNQDCNAMAQVCQALVQLVQQAAAPEAQAPEGEPVFRKGGKLVRRIKK